MHPALQPYVDPKPVRSWRYVLAGALVGLIGSRVAIEVLEGNRRGAASREDVAQLTVKKLAYEAYPQWRTAFWNGPTCPITLDALVPWMTKSDTLDPWGTGYAFWCGRTAAREPALHVVSAGSDRRFDTADDIGSEL